MRTLHTLLLMIGAAGMLPAEALATRGKLMADCIIQLKGTKEGQTRLTVMPGSNAAYTLTPMSSHFVLELTVDETYLLTFEHPGCVTKQLYVDATVPVELRGTDFDFPLKVVLEYRETQFSYAGPVGFIFYEHGITDFSYTTDHSITMNESFMERMAVLQRTGTDPRTATVGYTASTTDPRLLPAEAFAPRIDGGTVAPMVSESAPLVHRLARRDSVAQLPEVAEVAPLAVLTPPVPAPAPIPAPPVQEVPAPLPAPVVSEPVADRAVHTVALAQTEEVDPWLLPSASTAPSYTYEVLVEEQRVITIIRVKDSPQHSTEYRRVLHRFGGVYYFQDGRSISAHSYDQGTAMARAMADQGDHQHLVILQ